MFALTRKTTDPAERVRAVDRLAPWGATALYDVILRGIDMLGRQTGRKALVVFSDGEDQGSHVALEDVERRLQASDVTLYMIAQGRGVSHEYLQKGDAAADRCRPAAARSTPTASTSCRARSRSCSTSCRISICSAISRPTPRATTRGARSRSRSTATATSARGRATARSPQKNAACDRPVRGRCRLRRSCLWLLVGGAASSTPAAAQTPVFRSSVEVTSLDVGVVDRDGKPITDLTPQEFVVRVDGAPRRVVSAEWVSLVTPPRPEAPPPPPGYSTNENATGGRLILIVIDQPNIRFGGTVGMRRAVNGFIDRLQPSDRIAAVGIGPGSNSTPFTADRERVKQAIARMPGAQLRTRCLRFQHRHLRGDGHPEGRRRSPWSECSCASAARPRRTAR